MSSVGVYGVGVYGVSLQHDRQHCLPQGIQLRCVYCMYAVFPMARLKYIHLLIPYSHRPHHHHQLYDMDCLWFYVIWSLYLKMLLCVGVVSLQVKRRP